jgi:acetyl esterase/lipase
MRHLLPLIVILFFLQGCVISKHKDITYLLADTHSGAEEMKLDVFSPKISKDKKDVLIFLHGGGWNKGDKSTYSFFGKRLARKGIVSVIINYPLSPKANYNDMAIAAAKSVKWVKENINQFGGDSSRVFISGHSAGGHLAAVVSVEEKYFDSLKLKNPIKGTILIDAAGLDMNKYLTDEEVLGKTTYMDAFTKDHTIWKEASPIYHLHEGIPPMHIYVGGKTYPNIRESNDRFQKELLKYSTRVDYKIVPHKHHVPMIFQFYNSLNPLYKEILKFMKDAK